MPSTRRTVILAGLTFLSGCTSVKPRSQETSNDPTTQPTETTDGSGTSDISNPDETLQFGEPYVDTSLEITVETPSIETVFQHNGETYHMPDGDALAFAAVTFHNTNSEGSLPIDGPIFTLLSDGTETLETHSVEHPEFDPTIRVRQMEDVPTTQRWTSQGGTVSPGERLSDTAVFRVSESTDPSTLSLVYESDRIADDRFGNKTVAWTQ